jgi:O-antigen ligase
LSSLRLSGRDLPAALPGALALGVFLAWAAQDGGYATTRWLLGGIFVLALLVVTFLTAGVDPLPGPVLGSVVLFAAFTAWSGLSIAWADVKGDAWDGANRTLLYFLVYLLFVMRRYRPTPAALLLGAFSLGVAAIGAIDFLRAVQSSTPLHFFISGRFASPIAYPNATAALFVASAWPALLFASRREVPVLVRGLMLAATGVLAELALMGQSRASLFAVPFVGALYFAITPGRVRSIVVLVPVVVAVWVSGRTLIDVYTAVTNGTGIEAALVAARTAVIWSAVALFGVGIVIALVDRLLLLPERAARVASRIVAGAAVAAMAAVAVSLVVAFGSPFTRAADGWRQFKENAITPQTQLHLVSGLGSGRYDLWRVATLEFKRAPVVGIGVDNFAAPYLRERRTAETPLYPHSLEFRVLSQTGIVGTLLFVGFLSFAGVGVWRSRRAASGLARVVVAGATVAFAYWFVHGSVDWLWEFPALGAPAFAWLALALRTSSDEPDERASEAAPRRRRIGTLAVAILALPVVAAFAIPWLAAREVDSAAASWRANPERAFDQLDLARRLNPLTDKPDLTAGVIATRLGDRARARAAFGRAIERNHTNWYAYLQLGIVDSLDGRDVAAGSNLRRALELNPRDPVVHEVARFVEEGRRVSPAEVERLFSARLQTLLGKRQT